MSDTDKTTIDARLSTATTDSFKEILSISEKWQKVVSDLNTQLKQVERISKAIKLEQIDLLKGGKQSYIQGQQVLDTRAVNKVAQAGTPLGLSTADLKAQLSLIRDGNIILKQGAEYRAAANLNIKNSLENVSKINDLEKAELLIKTASNRAALAAGQGITKTVAKAEKLVVLARQQAEQIKLGADMANALAQAQKKITDVANRKVTARGDAIAGASATPDQELITLKARKAVLEAEIRKTATAVSDAKAAAAKQVADRDKAIAGASAAPDQELITLKAQKAVLEAEIRKTATAVSDAKAAAAKQVADRDKAIAGASVAADDPELEAEKGRAARRRAQYRKDTTLDTQAQSEAAAASRAAEIRRLNTGDPELEAAMAEQARRRRHLNLTSDGGAGLFMTQAAVATNFLVMNSLRNLVTNGLQFTAQFDDALRNLQSIVVVTDQNMVGLKQTILDVANASKFSAVELTQGAVILGQAGLNMEDIRTSLGAIANLATATGTSFETAAGVTTSILSVFNMEAARTGEIANTMTAAVNGSKLSMESLAAGIQYAGQFAADAGVSFEELTASLGVMSDAGIRSGSTLGTGMRQVLAALEKPSGNFKAALDRLGISIADVDVKSNGLYGVLKNLKDGGFSAADAINSFDIRAASAFNALSGNLDGIVKMERAFLNSSAATKAAATQMESFSNQSARLTNATGAVISQGMQPLLVATTGLFSGMSDLLTLMQQYPALSEAIVSGLTLVAGAFGVVTVTGLASGLVLPILTKGVQALGLAGLAAGEDFAILGLAGSELLLPLALVLGAVAATTYALQGLGTGVVSAAAQVASTQTAFDNVTGTMDQTQSQIGQVEDRIRTLSEQQTVLNKNSGLLGIETDKVRNQFRDMGIVVGNNVTTVQDLINALKTLKGQLDQKYLLEIGGKNGAIDTINTLITATQAQGTDLRGQAKSPTAGMFEEIALTDKGTLANIATLGNKNATLDQLYTARGSLQAQKAGIDAGSIKPDVNKGFDSASLQTEIDLSQKLIDNMVSLNSLTQQRNDLVDTQVKLSNKLDPINAPLIKQVASLTENAKPAVDNASSAGTDTMQQLALARVEYDKQKVALDAELLAIDASTTLSAANKEDLKAKVSGTMGILDVALKGFVEAAKSAADATKGINDIKLKDAATQLAKQARLAPDQAALNTTTVAQYSNSAASQAKDTADFTSSFIGNKSGPEFQAGLEAINQAYRDRNQAIYDQAQQYAVALINTMVSDNQRQQQELQNKLSDPRLHGEEKDNTTVELINLIEDGKVKQIEAVQKQVAGGIQSQSDADAAIAKITADSSAQIQGIQIKSRQDDLDAANKKLADDKTALAAVVELAKTAKDLATKNKLLQQALVMAGQVAIDGNAVVAQTAVVDPALLAGAKAQAQKDAAQAVVDARSISTYKAPGSGGGGTPASVTTNKLDQWKAQIDLALEKMNAGGSSTAGIGAIDIVSQAKAQKTIVESEIASMQNRKLSTAEQKKLNGLVKDQLDLTKFIDEQQKNVTLDLLRQGDLLGAVNSSLSGWAKDHLDLVQTAADGLNGVFDSATSGLTDFFTSWADGSKTAGQAMKGLAIAVLQSLEQMFAKMLAVYLLQKLMGFFGISTPSAGNLGQFSQARIGKDGGGEVRGAVARDSVPHNLMPGEFVVRSAAVKALGIENLKQANALGGRMISKSTPQPVVLPSASEQKVNVYVVAPGSRPSMGPSDVLAVISDDILRGGTTKKLIKSITNGSM